MPATDSLFTFNETAARAYAARCLRRHAAGHYPPYSDGITDPAWPDEDRAVPWNWNPRETWDRDDLPGIEDIIPDGVACGAISCPPGTTVYLITMAGDPITYQWDVPADGAGFALRTPHFEKLSNIGSGRRGGHAIVDLLAEAAAAASGMFREYRGDTPAGLYTRAQVTGALNTSADLIGEFLNPEDIESSDTIVDTSILDLAVNTSGYLLDHPGAGLDEVIAASYTDVDPDFGDLEEDPERGSAAWNAAVVRTVRGWFD
jgi:hypothetical protein